RGRAPPRPRANQGALGELLVDLVPPRPRRPGPGLYRYRGLARGVHRALGPHPQRPLLAPPREARGPRALPRRDPRVRPAPHALAPPAKRRLGPRRGTPPGTMPGTRSS